MESRFALQIHQRSAVIIASRTNSRAQTIKDRASNSAREIKCRADNKAKIPKTKRAN